MTSPLVFGTGLVELGLVVVLFLAARRGDLPVATNALVAIVATMIPPLVEVGLAVVFRVRVDVGALVPFWIAIAGLLHVIGMTGRYESSWWWDHVTHFLSAGMVAATAYGFLLGVSLAPGLPSLSPVAIAGLTLLLTLGIGVAWELVELVVHRYGQRVGVGDVLIPYGARDTALDLVFDLVGAAVVVGLDVRVLVPLARAAPRFAASALLGAGVLVLLVSVGAGVALARHPATGWPDRE